MYDTLLPVSPFPCISKHMHWTVTSKKLNTLLYRDIKLNQTGSLK